MAAVSAKTAAGAAKTSKVENTTTETEKAVETANTAPEEVVKLVYVGPTLPKGQLKQNSIFEGTEKEIKKELEKVLEKYPLAEKMLVPVRNLAEAKRKAGTAGNIMNKWYADIASGMAGEFKEE